MKIIVNKTCATVSGAEMLTSGMVGKTIDVEFSADWIGLIKIAVFTNGAVTRDVLDPNGAVIIPWEVLATPNKRAQVGFYGYKMEGGEKVLAVPTIWAELGTIRAGADPSGDPSAELSPTVAEQLQSDVNDLDDRVTYIEEHGGGGSDFDIHSLMAENAIADADELPFYDASAEAPRKTTWSNLKAKLKSYFDTLYLGATALVGYATQLWVQSQGYGTYSKPSGGIPKTDLASAVQESLDKADTAVQPEAGKGLFSGNYNDLTNKPTIPSAVTESTVSGWGFTKNTGTYSKPSGGIPKTDLASAVQTSLGKADTALQSHQDISGKSDVVISSVSNITPTEVATAISQGKTVVITAYHDDFGFLSFEAWNIATNLNLVISNTTARVLNRWATISLQGYLTNNTWEFASAFIARSEDLSDYALKTDLQQLDSRVTALEQGGGADLSGVITCLNDINALLAKATYTEDVTALMAQLAEDIEAITPIPDIEQDGDTLIIRGGVNAEQNGSVLTFFEEDINDE